MQFKPPATLTPAGDTFELTLTKGRFQAMNAADVIGGLASPIPDTFELLCYNGTPVGPTIRVHRGTKFKIRVRNALHGAPDPGIDPTDTPTAENVHGLCTTNLHTHGLHVSPSGKSDNIFRQIEPGEEFTFEYEIGSDHPSGTFWYHPHKHGSTAYQLSNGVSGALIVEGDGPNDLDQNPQIKAANAFEKVVVLQSYTFGTYFDLVNGVAVGFIDGTGIYNANEKGLVTCDAIKPDPATVKHGLGTALAVNGTFNPQFDMRPGEVHRWRVVHAGWDIPRQFAWFKDDGSGKLVETKEIQSFEIALDGLATGRLASLLSTNPGAVPASTWSIAPGQRSDILIQAPDAPSAPDGTYYLVIPPNVASNPSTDTPIHVAKLVVKGVPNKMQLPNPADLARCVPFPSLLSEPVVSPTIPTANDQPFPPPGQRDLSGTLSLYSSDATHIYTLNGLTFHALASNPIPLKLGTTQQWVLRVDENSDSGHPFHIHVNPFQVLASTDRQGNVTTYPDNVWRDTLFVDVGFTYTIRSKFKPDIAGLSVLHCHILDHEDQGMMWPIRLSNDDPPAGRPAAAFKPVASLAPAIRLPDAVGRPKDLAEFRGRRVALVFFRGIQCSHCAEQLRDLVREARGPSGVDAEIVAVSSSRIKDPARALKALGLADSDRLHLLVDEANRSFREYGCLAEEPRHGLFLIDGGGTIRWAYVGETPFADARLAIERLRTLPAEPKDELRSALSRVAPREPDGR